jgi:tetratricopeptide (TPR) repeat protein
VQRVQHEDDKTDLDAMSVLRHEYAHHFMFNNFENMALPMWFVEGFAEFNATATAEPDGSVTFGKPPLYRAAALAYDRMPIRKLLSPDLKHATSVDMDQLYGKGWLLVHYLTFTPARKGQLTRYLDALNAGKTSLEAGSIAFGDLDELDRDLGHYFRAPKISVISYYANALKIGQVTIRKLTPGESATMLVRVRSNAGVDSATAKTVLASARRAAKPYPADPGAQLALAEAEYDAGNYAECEQAANRALAADLKREKAFVYKGMAMMAAARAVKKTDSATWDATRAPLVAANRLEPDDPEPLMLFYDSFIEAGARPTANALAGLRQAFYLAPQDSDLRSKMVVAMIDQNNMPEARSALAPLAFDPHGGKYVEKANALLAAIDSGDKTEISKKLEAFTAKDDQKKN